MPKGSETITFRPGDELLAAVRAALEKHNSIAHIPSIDLSEWLRRAMREKLSHLKRSNRKKARREELAGLTEEEHAIEVLDAANGAAWVEADELARQQWEAEQEAITMRNGEATQRTADEVAWRLERGEPISDDAIPY